MPNFRDPIDVTDADGVKHRVVDTDGTVHGAPTVPAGSAALLETGTDTVQRTWSAKEIHDEIARQIAEIP